MAERTIVTRKRRAQRDTRKEFQFTPEMIPAPGSDGAGADGAGAEFLRDYRLRAWQAFEDQPLPKTTDEPWRRTDIRGLDMGSFRLPEREEYEDLPAIPDELLVPLVGDQQAGQIVMLPGGTQSQLNAALKAKGVIFTDLQTAEREHADILAQVLGQTVQANEGKFAALAAAMARNGVLLYVPQGLQIELPFHSVLWGPGVGLAHFSHILVWIEDGASVTYVHEAASPTEADGQTMHAGIVEMRVGDAANFHFVELQSWGEHVWNFSHERARIGRDSHFDWVFAAVGSHLTKNFSDLDLIGQGSSGRVSGFYFTNGIQHLDHDTQQNHMAPDTVSDLLFKGALVDRSRSVWQGMIYVAPGAQKTDGYQANRNLVLSKKARADSIPGLEIMADDVRCTHGATVGKIDQEQVFYLLSRGISYPEAVRLIVEGFFDPIMQRVPFEGVRNRLAQAISKKMSQS